MKLTFIFFLFSAAFVSGQTPSHILLKADRLFDGVNMHVGWSVLITGNRIQEVGVINNVPENTIVKNFPGCTLMPGLIEGHSHLFLHPYNETSWDEQVLNESRTERIARAINHARATLMAGFTTVRDLGTEGAGYDDVALKRVIQKGIVIGPRIIAATRAIVAKGSYGPKSLNVETELPQGAAEAGNINEMISEVRTQIGKGADLIKIYADYRGGIHGETTATFSIEEIRAAVNVANSSGRKVAAHAGSAEGMRRAILGGVSVIEHGDEGTPEIFALMKANNTALCATLSAGEAIAFYRAEKRNMPVDSTGIKLKMKTFSEAMKAGLTICMGGDVGVFAHGENAREAEAMVRFGMKNIDVLRSATSVNAGVFGYENEIGKLSQDLLADVIAVEGDPSIDITAIRKIKLVMKDGKIY